MMDYKADRKVRDFSGKQIFYSLSFKPKKLVSAILISGPECDIRDNFGTNEYIRIYSNTKFYTNEGPNIFI